MAYLTGDFTNWNIVFPTNEDQRRGQFELEGLLTGKFKQLDWGLVGIVGYLQGYSAGIDPNQKDLRKTDMIKDIYWEEELLVVTLVTGCFYILNPAEMQKAA